jgi:hypothetical protein
VSGFACRIHDSPTLKEAFDKADGYDEELSGTSQTLARRVPTHWNSDLDCLASHLLFKDVVIQISTKQSNNLASYTLSPTQWEILEELVEILKVSSHYICITYTMLILSTAF